MKKSILYFSFILLIGHTGDLFSQIEERFDDQDFLFNPTWTGDTGQFKINSNNQLQLNSTGADTSYLSTVNHQIKNSEWSFWLKLSFNTSSNNFSRVYIVSDKEDITDSLKGYFLQVGGGNDSLGFYRQTGISSEKLFTGSNTTTAGSTNIMRIKIIHDSLGFWHLLSDNSGNTNYLEEGSVFDNTYQTTGWFGIYCRYTSSNSGKFYFDDIWVGPSLIDTIPPDVEQVSLSHNNQMEILFSERIEKSDAEDPSHYSTVFSGSPIGAVLVDLDPQRVTLTFPHEFPEGICDTLFVVSIRDLNGNPSPLIKVPFCIFKPESFDVVISEIMADPDPVVSLPEVEYVELFNRTNFPVNLKDWLFQYGTHSKFFPETILNPKEFIIITRGDSLKEYGQYLDLLSSSSSLLNDGCFLVLTDDLGNVIHSIDYSTNWHLPSFKKNGGWSLEMIDPDNPCGCQINWASSVSDAGGTPGRINSLDSANPDTTSPYLIRARLVSDREVEVQFSEKMVRKSLQRATNWIVDNGVGAPESIIINQPDNTRINLLFEFPFQAGRIYSIKSSSDPTDCVKNSIDTSKTITFAMPEIAAYGDVIINEILADPADDHQRFVEIFNRSQNVLDLKDLMIGGFDTTTGSINRLVEMASETVLIFPGDYFALTKDPVDIMGRYYSPNPDNVISVPGFPTYQADQDIVVITRKKDENIIDKAKYRKEMHSPLLSDLEGISLERISPYCSTEEETNWHSSAESCGFATPAYKNSQYKERVETTEWVEAKPLVFSPDNNGIDDGLLLAFHPEKPGYYVAVDIYNDMGHRVRKLANNRLLSTEDQLIWDGTGDDQKIVSCGIYLIFADFTHPEGPRKQARIAVVVAGLF